MHQLKYIIAGYLVRLAIYCMFYLPREIKGHCTDPILKFLIRWQGLIYLTKSLRFL